MKPFVLRRLKSEVLQDLPKKIDHIIHVPMAPTQQVQYEDLVASYKNIDKVNLLLFFIYGMTMFSYCRILKIHIVE